MTTFERLVIKALMVIMVAVMRSERDSVRISVWMREADEFLTQEPDKK